MPNVWSKTVQKSVKIWVQIVRKLWLRALVVRRLYTTFVAAFQTTVHKYAASAPSTHQLYRYLSTLKIVLFQSVNQALIPPIHSLNKEENKYNKVNNPFLYRSTK
jgi:hypothetical protein